MTFFRNRHPKWLGIGLVAVFSGVVLLSAGQWQKVQSETQSLENLTIQPLKALLDNEQHLRSYQGYAESTPTQVFVNVDMLRRLISDVKTNVAALDNNPLQPDIHMLTKKLRISEALWRDNSLQLLAPLKDAQVLSAPQLSALRLGLDNAGLSFETTNTQLIRMHLQKAQVSFEQIRQQQETLHRLYGLSLLLMLGIFYAFSRKRMRHALGGATGLHTTPSQALKEKIRYVNGILSSMQSGLIVVNAKGVIQDCNPALEALTGESRTDLIGQGTGTLFDDDSAALATFFEGISDRLDRLHSGNPTAYWDMLKQMPLGCLQFKPDGTLLFVNPQASQLTGQAVDRLIGQNVLKLLPDRLPGQPQELSSEHALARKDGSVVSVNVHWASHQLDQQPVILAFLRQPSDLPWAVIRSSAMRVLFHKDDEDSILTRLRHREKESTPVRITASYMYDTAGLVSQTVINLHDVSSLIHKNDQIRQQHSLLEKTMEAMQDGVLQIDRCGQVVNANPKSLGLLSLDKSGIVGKNIQNLFLQGQSNRAFPNWVPAHHRGVMQEIRDHNPDNFWLLLRELAHPILGFDGNQSLRFINVAASQLLALDEDAALEQRFAECVAVSDQLELQAFIDNAAHETLTASPRGVHWLKGDQSALLVPSSFQKLGVGNQTWTMVCLNLSIEELKALAMQTNQNVEWQLSRQDHETIPVVLTAAPLRNAVGMLSGAVITLKDMREIKEKEAENVRMVQQMEQSQRLDALGQLAAGVAHDFNNLLGVIQNHAELVEMKVGPESKATRNLSAILQATTRARDIVIKLNGLGRDQLNTEEVDEVFALAPILDETQSLLQATLKGIDIAIEHATRDISEVQLQGDSGGLQQVLVNLCVNASHAIGERRDGRIIMYASRHQNNQVRIAVIDNGSGIPPATLPRIFEPFFTTKEVGKGTGLGLAMVRSIITKMGGTIVCESEVGVGTSFIVTLPLAA